MREGFIQWQESDRRLVCSGEWTLETAPGLERTLRDAHWPAEVIDIDGVVRCDTAGAWLLERLRRRLAAAGHDAVVEGGDPQVRGLLDYLGGIERMAPVPTPDTGLLEKVGRDSALQVREYLGFLAFIGESGTSLAGVVGRPRRMRWRPFLRELTAAGYRALPIVGLLAFLLGVVMAYQGGIQMARYGANAFIADLVGLSMVRELAPLITAIIVAGRTGSAFTAQIGTMKVTQELDALTSIGISPMEMLVVPKLLALVVALPLLTVFADILGVLGGMVVANQLLDISMTHFAARIADAVSLTSYLIGVGKAPVFAAIIAAVGCFHGFQVEGSAESVGQRTTLAVVQAIFLVIVVDALFSVLFSRLGL